MNILLTIKLAIRGLLVNKMRAFLTLLGIIIGVTGIIVIIAVGNGAESLIVNQVKSVGTNLIGILPGGSSEDEPPAALFGIVITTLKSEDILVLKDIPHVEAVSGYNQDVETILYKNRKSESTVNGVFADYPIVEDGLIEEGRFFNDSEDASLSKVVVLGSEIKQTLFGESNPIGESIKIRNHSFKVIGFFEERGVTGFSNADNEVYIPNKTMQKLILGVNHIALGRVKVDDAENVPIVVDSIKNTIRARHKIGPGEDDDFTVASQAQGLETISNITGSLKLFLTAIAAIALIVGGIGIMNVMYIAVTERTHEIGLRKALGAQRKDILNQFLIESVAITGLGGAIGIIIGVVISILVAVVIRALGYSWDFIIDLESIVYAVGSIAIIGITFGYAPAKRASQKRAIEALRYE
jgi:putative ABC transport system permease protein